MDGFEVLAIGVLGALSVSFLIVWLSSRSFDARYGKPGARHDRL